MKPRKYQLGLLGIVKNEEMIIREWIQHYLWQGVDHFYIIDNGSNDRTNEILRPYIEGGVVTYYYLPEKRQEQHYNFVYNHSAKAECEWLIICDVDEYIYNRHRFETIKSYLMSLDKRVSNVTLYWKMFGSSGYQHQPSSIRCSFIHRSEYFNNNVKNIIRTRLTYHVGIHDSLYNRQKTILAPIDIALNHYPIMSKEYFAKVKMTRGDVNTNKEWQTLRDWNYFHEYDTNDYEDTELRNLIQCST